MGAPAFLAPSPPVLERIIAALARRESQRHANSDLLAMLVRAGLPSTSTPVPQLFAVTVASDPVVRRANRYNDILPYDSSRILLQRDGPTAYVNASLLLEPDLGVPLERRWWIASQAPLPNTLHQFLALLLLPPVSPSYSSHLPLLPLVSVIVQVTPLVEGNRTKCHPYFPASPGETMQVQGDGPTIEVRLLKKEEEKGVRMSWLEVGHEGEPRRAVRHVEYLDWGDHGVPKDARHLIKFVKQLDSLNESFSVEGWVPPILAHCSAGVGRTGTLITISSLLPLLRLYALDATPTLLPLSLMPDNPLDPYPHPAELERDFVGLTIDGLRNQRTTMVQTEGQIRWIFDALQLAWEENLL